MKRWSRIKHIFTNASKNNKRMGCAYIDISNNFFQKFKLPENLSICSAEMTAISLTLTNWTIL